MLKFLKKGVSHIWESLEGEVQTPFFRAVTPDPPPTIRVLDTPMGKMGLEMRKEKEKGEILNASKKTGAIKLRSKRYRD